jgi:hypothetical protein
MMTIIENIRRTWRETFGSQKWGDEFWKEGFGELATYNAEVSRGIVHTKERKDIMRKLQDRYNHSERQEDGSFVDIRLR